MSLQSRTVRRRRGAATVELAVIAPVALLVFAAGIDIGRLRVLHHTVGNVAYEAAQAGLAPGASRQQVMQLAEERLALYRTRDAEIAVDAEQFGVEASTVTVRIRIPVNQNSWLLSSTDRFVSGQSTVKSNRFALQTNSGRSPPTGVAQTTLDGTGVLGGLVDATVAD